MAINFNVLNEEQGASHQEIVRRDPFDPAPLVGLLAKYEDEIFKMSKLAAQVIVADDESCQLATTYTTQAKALRQKIDKKHKELKAPYLEVTKRLDGFRKTISDRIQDVENYLNNKIRPYLQKKERERQEAERQAREEAARIQAELEAKARAEAERLAKEQNISKEEAEAMMEPVPVVVSAVETETKTVTETGTAKLKEKWVWQIIDFKALPNEAFESRKDEVTKALAPFLNAQVNAGLRNIPGLKIYKEAKIDTRTSRR